MEFRPRFDPDLPTVHDVLIALNTVAARYALVPSPELAALATELAYTMAAPEYHPDDRMRIIILQLINEWERVLFSHGHDAEQADIH